MSDQDKTEPRGGLWAYFEGRFYALAFSDENRHMDHVTWFYEIGLPDYGIEFDRVLRGRMIWDWHMEHYSLTFYGTGMVPNHVYARVTKEFNPDGLNVVERAVTQHWG